MSERVEWRSIYGRATLFVGGVAIGDCYASKGADGDVWRIRVWPEDRVQGGREKYVLSAPGEETAREVLLGMYERARREGDGA